MFNIFINDYFTCIFIRKQALVCYRFYFKKLQVVNMINKKNIVNIRYHVPRRDVYKVSEDSRCLYATVDFPTFYVMVEIGNLSVKLFESLLKQGIRYSTSYY